MMSEGLVVSINETACTRCIHKEVCLYKNDYLDIFNAVSDANVSKMCPDGKISLKKISSFDFIDGIRVVCHHYKSEMIYY